MGDYGGSRDVCHRRALRVCRGLRRARPQYLSAQARVGFAFYEYPDGAVLAVVVRDGLVSVMTGAGLEVEWCRLRGA